METTTNFGLKKYQSGDLFNPLTVNNPNMDDIDAYMKAISDRAIGRATELVSQGVHAITLLDADCKTFAFIATSNYSAGETFTVNGIQCNAYTPSGSALTSNAFITGSVVLGSLNGDGTAITFYVTGSAVADDSLKLGGELPEYYAKQTDVDTIETDVENIKNQNGNVSIAGIGDGTLSGAVSALNQLLIDKQSKTWTLIDTKGYNIDINIPNNANEIFVKAFASTGETVTGQFPKTALSNGVWYLSGGLTVNAQSGSAYGAINVTPSTINLRMFYIDGGSVGSGQISVYYR